MYQKQNRPEEVQTDGEGFVLMVMKLCAISVLLASQNRIRLTDIMTKIPLCFTSLYLLSISPHVASYNPTHTRETIG